MSYSFNTILKGKSYDETLELVISELKKEGFGVLTEIDIKQTLKARIDVDFRKYKILGACNPQFAYQALSADDKAGVLMLPCNVVVQEHENGDVEVSMIDPMAYRGAISNESIMEIAGEVREKLQRVAGNL